MGQRLKYSCVLVASALLSGCTAGNWNSIYRTFSTGGVDSQLVDVKQRSILQQRGENGRVMVCAEPSPDALSTYSSSIAAALENSEGKGSISAASHEAAIAFGKRTAAIQLLRDAYYRACEAHMSGAIDSETYDTLIRRLNLQAVAYLAIEQVTSTASESKPEDVSPPPQQEDPEIKKLKAEIEALDKEIAELDTKIKDPKTSEEDKKKLQAQLDEKKKAKAEKEKKLKELQAKGPGGGPNATAATQTTSPKTASVAAVQAAENIATKIIGGDYSLQMCFARMRKYPDGQDKLTEVCQSMVDQYVADRKDRSAALTSFVNARCTADGMKDQGTREMCLKAIGRWIEQDGDFSSAPE